MKKTITTAIASIMLITANTEGAGRSNPLIEPSTAPHGAVAFDKATPADYEDAIMTGLEAHSREIDAITSNKEPATFTNTIAALDRSGSQLGQAVLALSNLEAALGDTVLMNIMTKVTPLLSEHEANQLLNEKLWQRVKSVYDQREKLIDLTPEQQRLLSETYLGFAENGANLKGKDRERYRQLNSELSDLTVLFGQNVANDMKNPDRRLWVTADRLGGLPESIKEAARTEAAEVLAAEGKTDDGSLYLFTVYFPSLSPFLKYADDRSLREELYRKNASRNIGGEFDNTQVLKDIANIRLEIANLLGKETFAEYHLTRTMAQTPEKVTEFLEQLREAYTEPAKAELAEIETFAQQTEGPDFKLMPWDYSYWSDKLKNERYAFNDEDMKPYFELENTIKGVFGLATKLYGYTFKPNKSIPVYHPDVMAYEVYDADKKLLGLLYADFFYRPGKSPGAWMTSFRDETKNDKGEREIPFISIVCNFSKPVGGQEVLLTPYEVETFLHEFGHALHGLSSQATYSALSGTNVYHDFVELFSQFNENFLPEQDFLDGFARHYKTGKKMPKELLDKFVRSQQFGAAYACMRQLGFGYLDMAYHTIKTPLRASADIEAFEAKAQDPVRMFEAVEGTMTSPSFGHVFSGGYAAGYYGYKWSEALDADAFAAFKKKGIFDKETAKKFQKMLQSGGTVAPMELYVEFRGQEPSVDAMMRRDGIKK